MTPSEPGEYGFQMTSAIEGGRYMNYGEPFELDGHVFEAWQPATGDTQRRLVLRAYKDGELVREDHIDMSHPNIFGVDVEDAAFFNDLTEKVIVELELRE